MIEQHFDVGGLPELEIWIHAGRVELIQGTPGRVRVTVTTRDPNFIVEQRGEVIVVSAEQGGGWLSSSSAHVIVEAPEGCDATIRTASARVDSQIVHRKVMVKTASGDVELKGGEEVVVKTASGSATIGWATHALRFSAASGDLRVVERCSGSLVASTASGDVRVNDCEGVLEANTVSGDIQIRRFTGRQAGFKSMSGNLDLSIPTGTRVDLDASLLSGQLNLPDKDASDAPKTREMSVKARLVSGDLTITRIKA